MSSRKDVEEQFKRIYGRDYKRAKRIYGKPTEFDIKAEKLLTEWDKAGQEYVQWSDIKQKPDGTIEIWVYGTGDTAIVERVAKQVFGSKAIVRYH